MPEITEISNKALGEEVARRIAENGGKLLLQGFGSFKTVQRKERTARNPATGAAVTVPAHEALKFKPSKA